MQLQEKKNAWGLHRGPHKTMEYFHKNGLSPELLTFAIALLTYIVIP